jgi:hypothetical protein
MEVNAIGGDSVSTCLAQGVVKTRECDTSGQFGEKTTDDSIRTSMGESEFPAVTARWVADTVGMKRRLVHQRLEELHEQGALEHGKLSPWVVI